MAAVPLFRDTNMAAVPLFRDTNMVAVTSRENTVYVPTTCVLRLPLFANQRHILSSIF